MRDRGCAWRGHAWKRACMAEGGYAWQERRPLQRAVRILLECTLVQTLIAETFDVLDLLPAATKLGQGNKFTGVCLSTRGHRGVSVSVPNFRGGVSDPNFRGGLKFFFLFFFQFIFPQKNFFWDAHPPPPPPRRLMRGRYASYWNAFLFNHENETGNIFYGLTHITHRKELMPEACVKIGDLDLVVSWHMNFTGLI